MPATLKGRSAWWALILALFAYYLAVVYGLGFFRNPEGILIRNAPDADSLEYNELADWLWRGLPSAMIERRSYLYPLLMGLARMPFGALGIWFLQMCLWVASAVLFYANLRALLPHRRWRLLIFAGFCFSWTPIILSLMALTETIALFLFSVAMTMTTSGRHSVDGRFMPAVLICAGFLAALKPNYVPLLGGLLVLTLWMKRSGRWPGSWRALALVFALTVLPVAVQVGLYAHATGRFATSNVGNEVLTLYLYPQVVSKVEGSDFSAIRQQAATVKPSAASMFGYFVSHPRALVSCLLVPVADG